MRVENNGTRYFGLSELADAYGIKKSNKSDDKSKKKEKFLGQCKVCKQPLSYISDTNILACQNPECKGFKHTKTDKEGKKSVYYTPVFNVLDDNSFSYAQYLFDEKDVKNND